MRSRIPGNIMSDASVQGILRPRYRIYVPPAGGGSVSNPTLLAQLQDGAGSSPYVVPSMSPAANALIIVIPSWRWTGTDLLDSVSSGFGITGSWTIFANHAPDLSGGHDPGIAAAWAITDGSPGSGTVTCSLSDGLRVCVDVIQIASGFHTTTPLKNLKTGEDDSTAATTASLTLDSAPATSSVVIGAINQRTNSGSATPGSGYTELNDATSGGANGTSLQTMYRGSSASATVDWSALTASIQKVFIGFEVQAA